MRRCNSTTRHVQGLKADDPVQKQVLLATIELFKAGPNDRLGATSAQAWDNTQRVLTSMGQVKNQVKIEDLFSNAFLP